MFSSVLVLFCALSPILAGSHHGSSRHNAVAKRATSELSKRFSNARYTWYDVGLGACGKYNVPSDFIVALNTPQYGGGYPGPNCFKTITISANGKTTQATIMDQCPGCPYGGLDLSKGLFQFFAPLGTGVLEGEWWFGGDGGGGGGGGGGDDKPTTTKKHTSTPTSTWKWTPPATTSTKKTTSTSSEQERTSTTTHSTTSTTSTRTSTSTTSTSTSTSATPTSTPVNDDDSVQALNKAYADLNEMIVLAASSK